MTKTRGSGKGPQVKKEEEDAALTSSGQQAQQKRKKKDITKVKCFNCGALGHYASQCPRKKSKGEASETKAMPARVEKEVEKDDDCAMSAHMPLERKWEDIKL